MPKILDNHYSNAFQIRVLKKAKRFSYLVTNSADKVKEQLMKEYQEKHDNKLPICVWKKQTNKKTDT